MGKSQEEEHFHVEVIMAARPRAPGRSGKLKWEYQVKWATYPDENNTWEPQENLIACSRLLNSFWEDVGGDPNHEFKEGTIVTPSPEWIQREKAGFRERFPHVDADNEISEEQRQKQKQAEAQKKKKSTKAKIEQTETRSSSVASSSKFKGQTKHKARQESPARAERSAVSSVKHRTGVKRKHRMDDEDINSSSDDDDRPLLSRTTSKKKIRRVTSPLPQEKDTSMASNLEITKSPGALFSAPSSPADPTQDASSRQSPSRTSVDKPSSSTAVPGPSISIPTPAAALPSKSIPTIPVAPPKTPTFLTSSNASKAQGIAGASGSAGSALSTKQRLAQQALQAVAPGKSSTTQQTAAGPATPSVMKSQPSTARAIPTGWKKAVQRSLPSKPPTAHPKPAEPTATPSSAPPVTEENGMDVDNDLPQEQPDESAYPTMATCVQPPSPKTLAANEFLGANFGDMFQGPLDAPVDTGQQNDTGLPVREPTVKAPPTRPDPTQSWKWTGTISMNVSRRDEPLGSGILTDVSNLATGAMSFRAALGTARSICLRVFQRVTDLFDIMLACKRPQQFAGLRPEHEADREAFEKLAAYLSSRSMAALMPITLDDQIEGYIIFFTPDTEALVKRFDVPDYLRQGYALIAAVTPWLLPPSELQKQRLQRNETPAMPANDFLENAFCSQHSVRSKEDVNFHRAVRILNYPAWVHDYMNTPDRTYCIWHDNMNGSDTSGAHLEVMWLSSIMKRYPNALKKTPADALKALFIHVDSLSKIHVLPKIERHRKASETRFILFGNDPHVSPNQWGFREIYPIGGLVTFTATVLSTPFVVYDLLRKIAEHPLWELYVLPSIVGLAIRSRCGNNDPLELFDSGKLEYMFLLRAIADGQIYLGRAPLDDQHPAGGSDAQEWDQQRFTSLKETWVQEQLFAPLRSTRETLEYCLDEARHAFGQLSGKMRHSAMARAVEDDMRRLHIQPVIMANYRRYIVVKATEDNFAIQSACEWLTPKDFSFYDSFHLTPSAASH